MRLILTVALLSWIVIPHFSFAQQSGGLSNIQIENIARSVVQIIALDENGDPISTGSGTIASSTGTIFTNAHVVEGGSTFAIMMLEDMNELPIPRYLATPLTVFSDLDFAILQINKKIDGSVVLTDRLNLPFVDIAQEAPEPSRGDLIYNFGYPGIGDGYMVLTQGNITTIQNGNICGERMPANFQTDAEIAPGNSGGLAVNGDGVPVGIPTSVLSEQNTGGRLGGILPFSAIVKLIECEVGGREPSNESTTDEVVDPRGRGVPNLTFTCDTGQSITNGTEVTVVQMRPGFTYRATVIGINEFDPILMVVNPDRESGFCNDDNEDAARYTLNLPEFGSYSGESRDAQVRFTQNQGQMADMSLVVGGYEGQSGAFILILEGMAVTSSDQSGDPFSVLLTQSVVSSELPIVVYMVGNGSSLDPFIYTLNGDRSEILQDVDNNYVACDDGGAGAERCWGVSMDMRDLRLEGPGIQLSGSETDSMLILNPSSLIDMGYERLNFLMSSYDKQTTGDYTLIFIIGLE